MYRILVVDDEEMVLDTIQDYFEKAGYEVLRTMTGTEALKLIETTRLDCVILDIKLPDVDGFSICSQVRTYASLPILFLSNYTEEESRINGLQIGGDDYICKPFSMQELELRVQARIRGKYVREPEKRFQFDELFINTGDRTASYRGNSVEFSRLEFDILMLLILHPEQTYTYEQLYQEIWQEPLNKSRHNLQARVADLRQKLITLCPEKNYIQTVWKKGYRFVP